MNRWQKRSAWLLPAGVTLLVAILGVATNLATDLGSNWIAWAAVGVLSVVIAVVTAVSERRRQATLGAGGSVTAETSDAGHASSSHGLHVRHVRTASPDGLITDVTEIYNEELARESLRDDSAGGEK